MRAVVAVAAVLLGCGPSDLVVVRTVEPAEAQRFASTTHVVRHIPLATPGSEVVEVEGRFRSGDALPGGGTLRRRADGLMIAAGLLAVAAGSALAGIGGWTYVNAQPTQCDWIQLGPCGEEGKKWNQAASVAVLGLGIGLGVGGIVATVLGAVGRLHDEPP